MRTWKCVVCGLGPDEGVFTWRDRRTPYRPFIDITCYCYDCMPPEVFSLIPDGQIEHGLQARKIRTVNVVQFREAIIKDVNLNYADNVVHQRKDAFDMDKSRLSRYDQDFQARSAEYAVSVATKLPVRAYVNNFAGADVGDHIQVKWTEHAGGWLVLKKGFDKHNRRHRHQPHVLVTGMFPRFVIRGWAHPEEVCTELNWDPPEKPIDGHTESWWYPQRKLHWFATLPMPPRFESPDLGTHRVLPIPHNERGEGLIA